MPQAGPRRAFRVLGDGFQAAAPAQAPLRARTDQCTVYAPAGLPGQDLALIWLACRAALVTGEASIVDLPG